MAPGRPCRAGAGAASARGGAEAGPGAGADAPAGRSCRADLDRAGGRGPACDRGVGDRGRGGRAAAFRPSAPCRPPRQRPVPGRRRAAGAGRARQGRDGAGGRDDVGGAAARPSAHRRLRRPRLRCAVDVLARHGPLAAADHRQPAGHGRRAAAGRVPAPALRHADGGLVRGRQPGRVPGPALALAAAGDRHRRPVRRLRRAGRQRAGPLPSGPGRPPLPCAADAAGLGRALVLLAAGDRRLRGGRAGGLRPTPLAGREHACRGADHAGLGPGRAGAYPHVPVHPPGTPGGAARCPPAHAAARGLALLRPAQPHGRRLPAVRHPDHHRGTAGSADRHQARRRPPAPAAGLGDQQRRAARSGGGGARARPAGAADRARLVDRGAHVRPRHGHALGPGLDRGPHRPQRARRRGHPARGRPRLASGGKLDRPPPLRGQPAPGGGAVGRRRRRPAERPPARGGSPHGPASSPSCRSRATWASSCWSSWPC